MINTQRYADLEIRILERQEAGYRVEITLNPGQYYKRGILDLTLPTPDDAQQTGERLFAWLFADPTLKEAWEYVRGQHPQRHIRLRLDADAPELHALPWESLRDPLTGLDLAAADATPFSRFLAGEWTPGSAVLAHPLKMLVAIADPCDLSDYGLTELKADDEWQALQTAMESLDVALTRLPQPCTLDTLREELQQGYHILHLIAHGKYNANRKRAALYLADSENYTTEVTEADFAAVLKRQLADSDAPLRLVFLASCESAKRDTADAFRGLAPALAKAGVSTIVAMQESVSLMAARDFSRTFYRQLLQHGLVDLAGNQARAALLTAGSTEAATPVLFMRLRDGQLFRPDHGLAALQQPIVCKPFEPETIYIPAGVFLMGSPAGTGIPEWETPQHEVNLPAYRIGKYPVTNIQYAEFIRQTGRIVAPEAGWKGQTPPADKLNHPVAGVTWYDALAYCEWLSAQTDRQYSLPSEAQWEKAARGTGGRIYPWGDVWDSSRCHFGNEQIASVDAYPPQSIYGCYDMIGNVREWTRSLWGEGLRRPNPEFCYPWVNDQREDLTASHYVLRVYRGGGVGDRVERLRCSDRNAYFPDKPGPPRKRHGFRVVLLKI